MHTSMRNENNHNAHVNPTGLGPVYSSTVLWLVYFTEIIGCIGKLALGKMREKF